jgi:hypothetical protein
LSFVPNRTASLQHLTSERHTLRVVLLDPSFGGFLVGDELDGNGISHQLMAELAGLQSPK